jgi:hypothetical protein
MRDPILDGIDLPKGLRLTKPRLEVLKRFGEAMLAHTEIFTYRPKKPTGRSLYGVSFNGASQYAAYRSLLHAGLVGPVGNEWRLSASYWTKAQVALTPPLDIVAKRLAAQQALLRERQEQTRNDAAFEAAYEAQRDAHNVLWELVSSDYKTTELLEAAAAHQAAKAAFVREEARVEAAKEAAKLLPLPSLEEALAWLAAKELTQSQREG